MAFYQVMLEGKNFLIDLDGVEEYYGFVTTRWVNAKDQGDAELAALDLIKKDAALIEITKNVDGSDPKPMIYLYEMSIVNWFKYMRRKPGGGYTFYPMANEES